MVAAFRTLAAAAIDSDVLASTRKLAEILTVLAQRAPDSVADALRPELSLVVFPKDGTPVPFRVRFVRPSQVLVMPGEVARPRTRIACTRQALRHWVQGTLDVRDALARRTFLIGGDPAPFLKLADVLGRLPVEAP